MYVPNPIDTSEVDIPLEMIHLIEMLAENAHDLWAMKRINEGWSYGRVRDDIKREHPDLVPYRKLSESEKEYDRETIVESIKAMIVLGFRPVRIRDQSNNIE